MVLLSTTLTISKRRLEKTVLRFFQVTEVPHTLCLFINLSEMSIQKMTSWNYYKTFWMSVYTKILEPVFVKHYAPNICLPLNIAKFTQCRISTKIIRLSRKFKQVNYSSSPFQTASSNLADKVEMPFAQVHNSRKNDRICSNVNQAICSSSPISGPSFKSLAQIVFGISC